MKRIHLDWAVALTSADLDDSVPRLLTSTLADEQPDRGDHQID
jgi:hypothetical protein